MEQFLEEFSWEIPVRISDFWSIEQFLKKLWILYFLKEYHLKKSMEDFPKESPEGFNSLIESMEELLRKFLEGFLKQSLEKFGESQEEFQNNILEKFPKKFIKEFVSQSA